jgi:hypothetical protein
VIDVVVDDVDVEVDVVEGVDVDVVGGAGSMGVGDGSGDDVDVCGADGVDVDEGAVVGVGVDPGAEVVPEEGVRVGGGTGLAGGACGEPAPPGFAAGSGVTLEAEADGPGALADAENVSGQTKTAWNASRAPMTVAPTPVATGLRCQVVAVMAGTLATIRTTM